MKKILIFLLTILSTQQQMASDYVGPVIKCSAGVWLMNCAYTNTKTAIEKIKLGKAQEPFSILKMSYSTNYSRTDFNVAIPSYMLIALAAVQGYYGCQLFKRAVR